MSNIDANNYLLSPLATQNRETRKTEKNSHIVKKQFTTEDLNKNLNALSEFYRKSDFTEIAGQQSVKEGEKLSCNMGGSIKEEKKTISEKNDIKRGFPGTKNIDLKKLKLSQKEQEEIYKKVNKNLNGFDKVVKKYEGTSQKLKDEGIKDAPSPVELAALEVYSDGNYSVINPVLRGDKMSLLERVLYPLGIGPGVSMEGITKLASSGLNKLPDYSDKNVYRQITLYGDQLAQYEPGKIITEHAFTSTSKTREGAATRMGNTEYVIRSKTGKDVKAFSRHPEEEEVLFSPGTKFKVLGKEVQEMNGKSMNLIFMEEI